MNGMWNPFLNRKNGAHIRIIITWLMNTPANIPVNPQYFPNMMDTPKLSPASIIGAQMS